MALVSQNPVVMNAIECSQRRQLLHAGVAGTVAWAWASPSWAALPVSSLSVSSPPGSPLRIVASFSILADITRELAPAGAEVTALVGADADAHVFEPTPSAARRLAQADMVVINGLGFEGFLQML